MELCRLSDKDVMEIVNRCSEITKANVNKSSKLKELLTIPRYLTFLLEYEKQKVVVQISVNFLSILLVVQYRLP